MIMIFIRVQWRLDIFRDFCRLSAETLHETIKDFHNTLDRLKKFKRQWKKMYVEELQLFRKK